MEQETIYIDENLHKALKIKADELSSSVSDIVNQTIRDSLAEDLDDLESFKEREAEPSLDFEQFLKGLKSDG